MLDFYDVTLTLEVFGNTFAAFGAGRFAEGVNLGVVVAVGTKTGGVFGGLGSRFGVGGLLDDVTSKTTISGTYPMSPKKENSKIDEQQIRRKFRANHV